MKVTCPRCAATVQPDWDYCHECGYDGSDLPPVPSVGSPRPTPPPLPTHPLPVGAPVGPPAGPPSGPAGPASGWQSWSAGAKAAVVVSVLVVALVGWSLTNGGSSGPDDQDAAADSEPGPADEDRAALAAVCDGAGAAGAAPHEPGTPSDSGYDFHLTDGTWQSRGPRPSSSGFQPPPVVAEVDVVVCTSDVGPPRTFSNCQYDVDGRQRIVDVSVQDVRVVVHVAATAEVLHEQDVPHPATECPTFVLTRGGEVDVLRPDSQVTEAVAPYVDGP